MLAKRLSDLSPDQAQQYCQKVTEAEEQYQTIRDRVREAAGVLEESLPRYTQVIYTEEHSKILIHMNTESVKMHKYLIIL